ncbi:MAG: septal ring lytic transglycosylase RlpA family protein [Solirubrobacterales bacterium]
MKAGRNRLGRKDHPQRARQIGQRLNWRVPSIGLLLVAAAISVAIGPAQAATGGASTHASTAAQVGGGIAFSPVRLAGATWYGPGLYGNNTACGQVLRPSTTGVAHRKLPCGTVVRFTYRGRQVVTRVIDRGPYSEGNDWDLTQAVARALGFEAVGADKVGFAIARGSAQSSDAKRRARR